MKLKRLTRFPRRGILYAVTQCATRITERTLQDDKRVSRSVGYINDSLEYAPITSIADEELGLALYVDADFGGPAAGDRKSTSGFVIAPEGRSFFAMLA